MLKAALGLGVAVAIAYAAMPDFRGWILASAPFLFFLLCPLMMFFMMKGMHSCDKEPQTKTKQADASPSKPLLGQAPLKD
ncbi:DUF2933 domain-containing protein [Alcaligenaceae bacterium]|nr:DUF2933 domain-containing protein [Alcaligenaceae bacterium]